MVVLISAILILISPVVRADNELITTGDTGEMVVRVQTRLMDLGYYTYKPTGFFQSFTRASVIAYQKNSGLMADGSIGSDTMSSMFHNTAMRAPFAAGITLSFSVQSRKYSFHGSDASWSSVQPLLIPGQTYILINCATGDEIRLTHTGGENHADMIPADEETTALLNEWMGEQCSYYKCAMAFVLDSDRIASSIQWCDGSCCVYFRGSGSQKYNLQDVEHNLLIDLVTDKSAD